MKGLLDLIDGGGMGAKGNTFEGGPLSGLLNAMGVRPHGYADRMEAMQAGPQARPQQRPPMQMQMPAPPPMQPVASPRPVSLPPMQGPAGMGGPPRPPSAFPANAPLTAMQPRSTPQPVQPNNAAPVQGGFNQFVQSLGPAAEGVSNENLREAYRLFIMEYPDG